MSFVLRLLWILLTSPRRARIRLTDESTLTFRAWPPDCGISIMHNEAYLKLMELGRWDLTIRTGAMGDARAHAWLPIVAAQGIRYRRPIKRFATIELRSRVVHWDDRDLWFESTFVQGDVVMARGIVRCRARSRSKSVSLFEIARRLDFGEPPSMPTWLASWIDAEDRALSARATDDAPLPAPSATPSAAP